MNTPTERIAIVDVHYWETGSMAACALAQSWTTDEDVAWYVQSMPQAAAYRPGSFFARELPCILAVLDLISIPPSVVVVDGHAVLGDGAPGLGARLYAALDRRIPVVGVAKNPWPNNGAIPVLRGTSRKPLFVTAVGMTYEDAANAIRAMHGAHRIPTLLKLVDRLTRQTS